jgi:serine/threonine protein kinase
MKNKSLEDSRVKISDLGLKNESEVIANSIISGTPAFIPPEILGNSVEGADLFSADMIVYNMLTEERAFGSVFKIMYRQGNPILNVGPLTRKPASDCTIGFIQSMMAA